MQIWHVGRILRQHSTLIEGYSKQMHLSALYPAHVQPVCTPSPYLNSRLNSILIGPCKHSEAFAGVYLPWLAINSLVGYCTPSAIERRARHGRQIEAPIHLCCKITLTRFPSIFRLLSEYFNVQLLIFDSDALFATAKFP